MTLGPLLRKGVLVLHITASVGWLGAIGAFLVLAVAAATGDGEETLPGLLESMRLIAWVAILPLSLASLVTGTLSALTSGWGLVRHYWVLVKLALNAIAVTFLMGYLPSLDLAAQRASLPGAPDAASLGGWMHVVHAAAAGAAVLAAAVLSVYKPRGATGIALVGRRAAGKDD